MKQKFYLLLVSITIVLLLVEYILSTSFSVFTRNIPMIGTLFLGLITFLSFYFTEKSISHENPNRFVRGVMLSTMIKFFLSIILFAAILISLKKEVNKADIFLLMFVYMIYSTIESLVLSKLSRVKKKLK